MVMELRSVSIVYRGVPTTAIVAIHMDFSRREKGACGWCLKELVAKGDEPFIPESASGQGSVPEYSSLVTWGSQQCQPCVISFSQLWSLVSWKQILLSLSTPWVLSLTGSLGGGVLSQQSWPWPFVDRINSPGMSERWVHSPQSWTWKTVLLNLSCCPPICFILNWGPGLGARWALIKTREIKYERSLEKQGCWRRPSVIPF